MVKKGEIREVTILGEVNNPGTYEWHQDLSLVDLLARAGNNTKQGDVGRIRVIDRQGKADDFNLLKYFNDNNIAANPTLNPGDIVLVGETEQSKWEDIFFFVGGLKNLKDLLEIKW